MQSRFFLGLICSTLMVLSIQSAKAEELRDYQAKDFSYLLNMKGCDQQMLKNHFILYQGYVAQTNLLLKNLAALRELGKERTLEYGALKRRLGWEFNGMRLHEWYFENLGGVGSPRMAPSLVLEIAKQFGSFNSWKQDFIATGMMRGIGWVVLYKDNLTGKMFNEWIQEHDVGNIMFANAILVMDVWEHAYMIQYGLNREEYISYFFAHIDWGVVEKRFNPGK